jgi:hypothetical protein
MFHLQLQAICHVCSRCCAYFSSTYCVRSPDTNCTRQSFNTFLSHPNRLAHLLYHACTEPSPKSNTSEWRAKAKTLPNPLRDPTGAVSMSGSFACPNLTLPSLPCRQHMDIPDATCAFGCACCVVYVPLRARRPNAQT